LPRRRRDAGPITENWIAVASAEHVLRSRGAGFMEVCHAKAAPLRRIRPHDRVAYQRVIPEPSLGPYRSAGNRATTTVRP